VSVKGSGHTPRALLFLPIVPPGRFKASLCACAQLPHNTSRAPFSACEPYKQPGELIGSVGSLGAIIWALNPKKGRAICVISDFARHGPALLATFSHPSSIPLAHGSWV